MAHDSVKFGLNTAQATTHGVVVRAVSLLQKPAFALAFLVAAASSVFVVQAASNINSDHPAQQQTSITSPANEAPTEQNPETTEPSYSSGTTAKTQSLSTRSTLENGQANVQVEVNGQKVPVKPEGQTHQTITGENSQSTIDVNITNDQSTTSVNSTGSNTTSLSTSTFQSQSVVISP